MAHRSYHEFPAFCEAIGEKLKLARLRRNTRRKRWHNAPEFPERLCREWKRTFGSRLGIYARVMQVLRLEEDLAKLAVDDPLGRKLQDTGLAPKRRAPNPVYS